MYNRKYTDDELAKLLAVWNEESGNTDTLEEFKYRMAEWQLEQVYSKLKQRLVEMQPEYTVSVVVEAVKPAISQTKPQPIEVVSAELESAQVDGVLKG